MTTFRLIDLFCGCGGMTLGFMWKQLFSTNEQNPICRPFDQVPKNVKFNVVFSNDNNTAALTTYMANFDTTAKHSSSDNIEDYIRNNKKIPVTDVIIGGPPCQGFSLLNKNRKGDVRRELWWHFLEIAEKAKAKVIVMENVPQLIGSPEFERIKERLNELNFKYVMAHVLNSANFGAPQTRKRSIIIASHKNPISLPIPTHLSPEMIKRVNGNYKKVKPIKWRTTKDAIGKLRKPQGTEIRENISLTYALHFGRTPTQTSIERYKAVPFGGNRFDLQRNRPDLTPQCWINKKSGGTDLFGRLWWNKPSVTIRTEFFKPEKGRYLHPTQDRPITHREAARLQAFPDSFLFIGSKIEIAKQIGNAVPPLLSYAIAKEVMNSLMGKTSIDDMNNTVTAYKTLLNEVIKEAKIGT